MKQIKIRRWIECDFLRGKILVFKVLDSRDSLLTEKGDKKKGDTAKAVVPVR